MFESVRKVNLNEDPVAAVYCPQRAAFVTAAGSDLTVHDARSGRVLRHLFGVRLPQHLRRLPHSLNPSLAVVTALISHRALFHW